jgi:hypothetical protein
MVIARSLRTKKFVDVELAGREGCSDAKRGERRRVS